MNKPNRLILLAVFFTAIVVPYILAGISREGFVFGGFLLNPIDGNSYLAKMWEGYRGEWLFTLPYTANPGAGAFLFFFYLFLGHAARWTGLSLIWVFHIARILAAFWMVWELEKFTRKVFPNSRLSFWTLALLLLGSGLGWIAILFGRFTSDFWVAEAYPFLSAYSNPHFPLGIALLLWIFRQSFEPNRRWTWAQLLIAGMLLALIMPFGVVLASVVLGAWAALTWIKKRSIHWLEPFWGLLGGIPLVLFQYWQTIQHPVLSIWNQQNVTPAPAFWDFLVSFSPVLFFAVVGLVAAWNMQHDRPEVRMVLVWFVLGLILVYLPFNLQRRFLFGFFIPCAFLAVIGMEWLIASRRKSLRWLLPFIVALSLPSNLMILLGGVQSAQAHSASLYLNGDEAAAMGWIVTNTSEDALILASPSMGSWIPAQTGRRVLYGHPFETVPAGENGKLVENFYRNGGRIADQRAWLVATGVDCVLYGPREQALMGPSELPECQPAFTSGGVKLCPVP